jgi:hypothetical protein
MSSRGGPHVRRHIDGAHVELGPGLDDGASSDGAMDAADGATSDAVGDVTEFEEGGYKQSGRGRLRGLASLDDFVEYKHIVLQPGTAASSAATK